MDEPHDQAAEAARDAVHPAALAAALRGLELFGDDPYLSMQATNLGMVDVFCSGLEDDLRHLNAVQDGTPVLEAAFLSAQSQMWMFAVYEALRTWRERARKVIAWAQNRHLAERVEALKEDLGYLHTNRLMRATQLEQVLADPNRLVALEADLRRIHILFSQLDFLRTSLAKHEVKGKKNSIAFAPGYGRINLWTGAIDFELSTGRVILGTLNRRQVADAIRAMSQSPPPPQSELAAFDAAMSAAAQSEADLDWPPAVAPTDPIA